MLSISAMMQVELKLVPVRFDDLKLKKNFDLHGFYAVKLTLSERGPSSNARICRL